MEKHSKENKINKKNKYIKVSIKLIVFSIIFVMCLNTIYNVTKMKNSYVKMENFFKQKEDFDVLFFGSSHVSNIIFPMELWKKYGIVSYNLGGASATIAMSYHNMLLALKETTPKLIVLDLYMITDTKKVKPEKEMSVHKLLDAYPISYTKYAAIKDLFGEENILNNSMEFLFNFSIYHTRWKELTYIDFGAKKDYEKGAGALIRRVTPNKTKEFNDVEMKKRTSINIEYFKKIIEYCKQNGIEILATYIPFPAPESEMATSKYMQTICDEYNINYINFLAMNAVNYDTDCYDKDSHLNISGGRKVTDYIGQYIMNNYNIQDQRQSESYSFWHKDYNDYIDYKIELLEENKEKLENYLICLYEEKDIKYEIKISSRKKIEEGTVIYNLLKNIGSNYQIDDSAFETNKDKTVKITTWDNRNGTLIDTVWW